MPIPTDMLGVMDVHPYPSTQSLNVGIPTPISMGSLVAWYKASDFDSAGDGVEVLSWYNSASCPAVAGNLTLTAVGAFGNRPTVSRNSINTNMTSVANTGHSGLTTAVGNTYLTSKSTWTWFGVVKFTNRTGENTCAGLTITNTEIRFAINSNGQFLLTYGNVVAGTNPACPSLNDWHFIVVVDSSDAESVYLDGQAAQTFLTAASAPTSNPTSIMVCQGDINASKFLTGNIAETGVFDKALSSDELTTLYTYFRTRYGLT